MADETPAIPGALQWVIDRFADAIEWLVETFDDPVISAAIRADVGLDPGDTTPPPVDEARLAGVRAFTDSANPDAESFAQVVEDVVAIAEALGGWVEATRTGDDETGEIVYLLLVLGATERIRIRSPFTHTLAETAVVLHQVFGAAPGVDESALAGALRPLFDLLRVVVSYTTPFDVLPERRLDEDNADRISHLVSILAVLLVEESGLSDVVRTGYGWDHPAPGSTSPIADELSQRALTLIVGDPDDEAGASVSLTTVLVPDEHGGPGMVVSLGGEAHLEHVVPRALPTPPPSTGPVPAWEYRLDVAAAGLGMFIPFSDVTEQIAAGDEVATALAIGVQPVLADFGVVGPPETRPAPRTVPAFRIGFIGTSLIEIGSFGGGVEFGPERARVEILLRDIDLVLELGDADQFVSTQGDRQVLFGFDLRIIADTATGIGFGGGSGLHVAIPISRSLLGVFVAHFVEIEVVPSERRDLALLVTGTFGFRTGPFKAVVQRMGMLLDVAFESGNLGLADVDIAFAPPRGIGLTLDIGDLHGGGFIFHDPARHEYAGVLELAWGPLALKAVAIVTTELPGGEPGWSLLVVLFGEFEPQPIGFGFFLTGLGGLIGVQHGVDGEALRSGMRTGVLDSVLFPKDPVANAPRLLNQMRVVFPITPRALTVGPFVLLAYARPALMELRLGLVFQLDNVFRSSNRDVELTRMVVVGQLLVEIPPKEIRPTGSSPLVKILVDLVGDIDLQAGSVAIDARLRDSKLAGMTLTGSLVVRARWRGEDRTWLVAAGGFHPEFDDLPAGLPKQERLGLSLKKGIATVKFECYLALTSNSFQFGARVFAQAKKWGFTVEGWLGFDALFEFGPPRFRVDIEAGVSLKKGSRTLMGVDLKLTVMGPGRWNLAGHAKFKVLFVSKTLKFDESWGSDPALALVTVDGIAEIQRALSDPNQWSAALPTGGEMLVSLRGDARPAAGRVHAHPLGSLTGIQRVAPLNVDVDRIGGARPSGARRFAITEVEVAGVSGPDVGTRPVREHFPTGQFLDLSGDQRLSLPSFERYEAGVEIGADGVDVPAHLSSEVDVETIRIPRPSTPPPRTTTPLPIDVVFAQAQLGAKARSRLRPTPFIHNAPSTPVRVVPTRSVAVDGRTLDILDDVAATVVEIDHHIDRDLADTGLRPVAVEEWEVVGA